MPNSNNFYQNRSAFSGIVPLVIFVAFFIALYFLAKGIFSILSWIAIPLILIALILDYTVVVDYGKYIFKLLKEKPLYGIGLGAFTIVGYPLVSAFLAFRAYMNKKIGGFVNAQKEKEEQFDDYEEVEDEDFLELEDLKQPEVITKSKGDSNEYEELFD